MRATAGVVVAAGIGQRLGDAVGGPKALVRVDGTCLLAHALRRLHAAGIDPIVVVHTPGHADDFTAAVRGLGVASLVPGGETRTASVQAGLDALGSREVARVAVHDAARAFMPAEVIRAAVAAVDGDVVAAAPGLPVADTLKRVAGDEHRVAATVDRGGLWAVQTPQVFDAATLADVRVWATGMQATDDLALVEQAIASGVVTGEVRLVRGSPLGLKVTYPDDLTIAEALARVEDTDG